MAHGWVNWLLESARIPWLLAAGYTGPIICFVNVCFFGYQAAGTPRREIQQYGPKGGYVYLDGEKVAIRAHIETLGGYSAHADQAGLVRFARPKSFCLVHGEAGAKEALREALVVDLASGMRDL